MHNNSRVRIFLIGFNRCGTTSFHQLFNSNQIASVHWYGNELARCLHRNCRLPFVAPLQSIDRWTAYSDLIAVPGTPWDSSTPYRGPLIEANRFFPQLHRAYPNSLFILNTRDPEAWIASRLQHDQGRFAEAYRRAVADQGISTDHQLTALWLQQWHNHHQAVRRYFQAHPDASFLEFHLGRSDPGPLIDHLALHYPLQCTSFPHAHRSTDPISSDPMNSAADQRP